MTPRQIEQMKVDRLAGTKGPWHVEGGRAGFAICDLSGATVAVAHRRPFTGDREMEQPANTRRIARVPDMEDHIRDKETEILRLRGFIERVVGIADEMSAAADTPEAGAFRAIKDAGEIVLEGRWP